MSKFPYFPFYPGDWQKEPSLRRCSKAAKGVFVDMLCLMFECEDRGVLSYGGKPWPKEEVAVAIGGDVSENLSCVTELVEKGVISVAASGALYSRRMVRDEQNRKANADRQARYRNAHSNGNSNGEVTIEDESEDENEVGEGKKGAGKKGGAVLPDVPAALLGVKEFEQWWQAFIQHRREIKKPLTPLAAKGVLNSLLERPQDSVAALKTAIRRSWQGFEWSWFDKDQKNGVNKQPATAIRENIKCPIFDPKS